MYSLLIEDSLHGNNLLLRGVDTAPRFSMAFTKGENFCDFLFASLANKDLSKGVNSKSKQLDDQFNSVLT